LMTFRNGLPHRCVVSKESLANQWWLELRTSDRAWAQHCGLLLPGSPVDTRLECRTGRPGDTATAARARRRDEPNRQISFTRHYTCERSGSQGSLVEVS
jgi:hypothetical protein